MFFIIIKCGVVFSIIKLKSLFLKGYNFDTKPKRVAAKTVFRYIYNPIKRTICGRSYGDCCMNFVFFDNNI